MQNEPDLSQFIFQYRVHRSYCIQTYWYRILCLLCLRTTRRRSLKLSLRLHECWTRSFGTLYVDFFFWLDAFILNSFTMDFFLFFFFVSKPAKGKGRTKK